MSVPISGATRLLAIVGDPIAQVRSPAAYADVFARRGIDAVMVPAHVLPDRFDATIHGLMALGNLDGIVVTVPYKARIVPFATRLGPTAALIGALNALRREPDGSWTGDMFDGAGFVQAMLRKGGAVAGRRVALFGAGGAGSAIACALAAHGVASLGIIDPDRTRAETLVGRLSAAFPMCDIGTATRVTPNRDMIVNASTVGMHPGDGLPGDIGALDAGTLVGDVVTADAPTALVKRATEQRCRVVEGRDMVVGQIDALLTFFRLASNTSAVEPATAAH
jgi:shikimate dehydrogenase